MAQDETKKPKKIVNQLSDQGYSETATKAIKNWYSHTKKA
jgi:predicted Ser/Thr protein kinase